MIEDILDKASRFEILVNNNQVNIENIKKNFVDLVEGAYYVPARAMMGNIDFNIVKQKGVWVDIFFDTTIKYGENTFDRLTLQLKPKYDFLVFYPNNNDKYTRPISINLAQKTTEIYNKIVKVSNEK